MTESSISLPEQGYIYIYIYIYIYVRNLNMLVREHPRDFTGSFTLNFNRLPRMIEFPIYVNVKFRLCIPYIHEKEYPCIN